LAIVDPDRTGFKKKKTITKGKRKRAREVWEPEDYRNIRKKNTKKENITTLEAHRGGTKEGGAAAIARMVEERENVL